MPRLCAIGLALLFGYLLAYHFRHERKDALHLGDFPTFYQAAQLARQHGDIYLAAASREQPYIYPPLVAFAYGPLTLLSKLHAAEVMLVVTAAMLLASLLVGARAMIARLGCARPGTMLAVALLSAMLTEEGLRAEMTMLETNALILLMFVLALWWLDRRPTLAGLALAVVMNIKYLSLVALPYLLLRRRWRAAGSMVIGTVSLALLPATLLGWHDNLRGIRIALGGLTTWIGIPPPRLRDGRAIVVQKVSAKLSLSVMSFFARQCGENAAKSAMLLTALTALVAFAVACWLYRKNRLPLFAWPQEAEQLGQPFRGLLAVEWAGLIAASLAFSPDTNPRHLVLTVLVNTLAATVLLAPPRLAWRWPAIAGVGVIWIGLVMPVRSWGPTFYYPYSIPGWSLLMGYLLILTSAVGVVRELTNGSR